MAEREARSLSNFSLGRTLSCPELNCTGKLHVITVGPCVNNAVVRQTRCNVCNKPQATVTTIIPLEHVAQFRDPIISTRTQITLEPLPKRLEYIPHHPVYPTEQEIKEQNLKVCKTCGCILPPATDRTECWACGDHRRKAARQRKGEAPTDPLSRFYCFTCDHSSPPANLRDPASRQAACSFSYPEAWTTEAEDCFLHSSNVP